ncbi:MAG TPA: MT-A70 family methyltransferase, partial [Saprospiraceae bacterium]|nr:MT-A70 family methyltransferase [Saprospiraceae bacterium]
MTKYKTILADPPWRYSNRTGKASPEHSRLHRYKTMSIDELIKMKGFISELSADQCHLYLWCTWPMISQGLILMKEWGFEYKTGIPWLKVAKNGEPDGRSMGFYGRVVTE